MNAFDLAATLMRASILLLAVVTWNLCRRIQRREHLERIMPLPAKRLQPVNEIAEVPPANAEEAAEQSAHQPSEHTKPIGDSAESTQRPTRFIVDSIVLMESFKYVCRYDRANVKGGFREVFHYAAGVQVDERTFVIVHRVPVTFSRQSAAGVRVADESNISALESLDTIGLPLVAHFHSHPGHGMNANYPSHTDRAFQARLERGGHIAIGAIFSRDGWLRFFAGDPARFIVEVQGNTFQKVEENVYRIAVENTHVSVGTTS